MTTIIEEKRLEIEYIISLTILILTFLAVPYLRELVEPLVAQAFLLIVSLHIVLFNVDYIFRVTGFKLSTIQKIEVVGRLTLIVVFLSFVYIFFHIIFRSFFANSLIPVIAPTIIVVMLTTGIIQKILKPYLVLRNVKILIAPEKIDVYSEYDDTEPLFIKIENRNKKRKLKVKINIIFPNEVLFNIEYDAVYDRKDKFSKEIELEAERAWIRNISMKYVGKKTRRDFIEIKIFIDGNLYEKSVEVLLKSQ